MTAITKQLAKFFAVGLLSLSLSLVAGTCQAYFKGAPAYNANYRPIYAHMGFETYVELSSLNIVENNNTWLVFNVLTASTPEDGDELRTSNTAMSFKINKQTKEAWLGSNSEWKYLELNRSPFGFEASSFIAVNICYRYMYGNFLNDSSGIAGRYLAYYKGN